MFLQPGIPYPAMKASSGSMAALCPFVFFGLLLLLCSSGDAHNITHILNEYPEFSIFNRYLTATHLAPEINRRRTITVCVVDNDAMSDLLAKHLSIDTIKSVLSLHVFADYFDAKKLHDISDTSTTTSSLYQATGEATGTSGYVNITDLKAGKVGFTPADSNSDEPMATFVKSVEELPYNISVIQISDILYSPEVLAEAGAEAPTTGHTAVNLTTLLPKHGCGAFLDLLVEQGVEGTFTENVHGGLTIFCPSDEALKSFSSKYKKLKSDEKASLLLYHAIPVYNSMEMLKSSNGLMNTLATEGANKFDFTVSNDGNGVKLETKVVTAKITETLIDKDPLVVYRVDEVLLPHELFKAPKSGKSRAREVAADAPGPAGDDNPADVTSSGGTLDAEAIVSVGFSVLLGLLL